MNKNLDLVILLNGNFVCVKILREDVTKSDNYLRQVITNPTSDNALISIGNKSVTVKTDSIVGWYFRDILESPTEKMIKFLDKKIPSNNDGEDWKDNE